MVNLNKHLLDSQIRKVFNSRGITNNIFYEDNPRVQYSNDNDPSYIFYIDSIIRIVEHKKDIKIWEKYRKDPSVYHLFIMEILFKVIVEYLFANKIKSFNFHFKLNASDKEIAVIHFFRTKKNSINFEMRHDFSAEYLINSEI